jgi:AcrR family transcriptional regulator
MSATPARRRGEDRTRDVAQAALAAFRNRGYRLTQVADVSERLGLAVGTIYRTVESKEALFHLAVLEAAGRWPERLDLPIKVTGLNETLAVLRQVGEGKSLWPTLRGAAGRAAGGDARAEAPAIAGELYDTMARLAPLILLLDRCAHEVPELAVVFDEEVRRALVDDLTAWVRRRGLIAASDRATTEAVARGALEAVAWLAKNRPDDPTAASIDDAHARAAAVRIFANAFG